MSRILTWRIPSLEHCAWICLPRSFGHRHHIKSIDLHDQLVIICQIIINVAIHWSRHLSLDLPPMFFWPISPSLSMLISFLHFFSSKVVNSSANLFIYCAIGARYFFNAFCVKNFMSASLITLSNNHIFQKSYSFWTFCRK